MYHRYRCYIKRLNEGRHRGDNILGPCYSIFNLKLIPNANVNLHKKIV